MKKLLLTIAITAAALFIKTSTVSAKAPGNAITDNTLFEVVIFKDEIKIGEALADIKVGEAYKIDFQNKVAYMATKVITTHPDQTEEVEEKIDYAREGVFLAINSRHATSQGVSVNVLAQSSHIVKMTAPCIDKGRQCIESPEINTETKKIQSEIAYGEPLTILLGDGYEINLIAKPIKEVEELQQPLLK